MRAQLTALRAKMQAHGVDYYMIPTDDFHGSEYVGEHFKCRSYVSGFTGSAGTLLVTQDWAGLWTDGRYFIQAGQQLAGSGIELCKMGEPDVPRLSEYIEQHLEKGQVLGFDGRVVSAKLCETLQKTAEQKGATVKCQMDLVGEIWTDRPALSAQSARELPESLVGQSRASKLNDLREALKQEKADAVVMASLMDVCWLMNLRGDDVACTPVVLSFAAVTRDTATLFVNPAVLNAEIKAHLLADGVEVRPYEEVYQYVAALSAGTTVMMNLNVVNSALRAAVPEGVKVLDHVDPTNLPKAKKNPVEVANFRQAHIKDGVAVTHFMYWLKQNVGKLPMTEISVAKKLEEFRRQQPGYLGPSFEPIMGYGPHGAIVHYSATEETNATIEPRSFLLSDTGGHYEEGTTDITRTYAVGPLTEEEKKFFTVVLKGHLRLGNAHFKAGCTGGNLDYLAREPLWAMNMDYNHGTGHGVGYILSVHEGPQSIHWNVVGRPQTVLEVGMVTSDEPGVYLEGKFGIRHENLTVVCEGETNSYGHFLHMENLTMVPFDLDAVEPALLNEDEKKWLNDYHALVRRNLLPYFEGDEAEWLKHATRAI